MIKITLLLMSALFFSACFNKDGISMKYHDKCVEYYDLQGYYHNDCSKGNFVSYEDLKDIIRKEKEPEPDIW